MSAIFDGKGSIYEFKADRPCPSCGKLGIYYLGSAVLHGNPYSPAADTEVEHYYKCEHCQYEWEVFI